MPPLVAKKPEQDKFVAARVENLQSKNTEVVLGAAGDVLRRTARAGAAVVAQAEKALSAIAIADVYAAVMALDPGPCRQAAERAASASFDAAFADSPEERQGFATSALDALMVRDRAESILFAARRRVATETARADVEAVVAEKTRDLSQVDASLSGSLGRSLTGINAERRASLGELDASERGGCAWFSIFSDADDMLPALGGTKTSGLTEPTRAALEASSLPAFTQRDGALVRRGNERHTDVESSALAHVALGTASPSERAFLEARAKHDASLARDLREAEAPPDTDA